MQVEFPPYSSFDMTCHNVKADSVRLNIETSVSYWKELQQDPPLINFYCAWPPIHPRCIISTIAPCYRIPVLLKRCLLSLRLIHYSSAVCHTGVHVWQTNSGINAELIHYWETHQPAEAQLCRRISVAFFIRLKKLKRVSCGPVLHHTKLKKKCKYNSWFHTDCINTV